MTALNVITLGERSFPVQPLTFDQLPVVMKLFDAAWGKPMNAGGFEPARDIIKIALDGQVTDEEFRAMRATVAQIFDAVHTIATVSGLIVSGEARAQGLVMETSSTGSTSMPASAPEPDGTGTSSAG